MPNLKALRTSLKLYKGLFNPLLLYKKIFILDTAKQGFMGKKAIYLVLMLLMLPCVLGATIRGSAYDLSLNLVNDAVIEINSTPTQRFVAKEGTFLFSLPVGDYKISASYETIEGKSSAEEMISVKDEGRYVLDLFLFPTLEGEDDLDVGIDFGNGFILKENIYILYSVIVILILIITILIYFHFRKRKKEEKSPEETFDIIKVLKKNNGEMMQKDIRKKIPLSEAKISLMISELVKEEKIEKIKKGRDNKIVLK